MIKNVSGYEGVVSDVRKGIIISGESRTAPAVRQVPNKQTPRVPTGNRKKVRGRAPRGLLAPLSRTKRNTLSVREFPLVLLALNMLSKAVT